MKKKLMDILACPIDKHYPLELHVFEGKREIVEGLIVCPRCLRWYPIRDEIPEMLPDALRKEKDELPFLRKWVNEIPSKILKEGKPFNLHNQLNSSV
ncbi:Trm112 family protein [Candidatus Bathyarchaeota archaeon]|nr:Trm112 family protein [Candidatus Bathyarchaeota archaeon]